MKLRGYGGEFPQGRRKTAGMGDYALSNNGFPIPARHTKASRSFILFSSILIEISPNTNGDGRLCVRYRLERGFAGSEAIVKSEENVGEQEMNLLEIKDLSFGYGREKVLKDINICMRKGESVGLIGANGVGKSTLLPTAHPEA